MRIITVHGLKFGVDAHGFGRHEADKDRGVDVIETELRKLDAGHVSRLHAADLSFQAGEGLDPPAELIDIECAGSIESTLGWHDPNGASLSLSAVEA